jgi:hypothetical protein
MTSSDDQNEEKAPEPVAEPEPDGAPPEDVWSVATGQERGQPLIFRFRAEEPADCDPAAFGDGVILAWAYDGAQRNGMPPQEEHARHVEFEEALEEFDAQKLGCQLVVITGGNRKRWLYAVKDAEKWLEALKQSLRMPEAYPLQVEPGDDIWGAWRAIANQGARDSDV